MSSSLELYDFCCSKSVTIFLNPGLFSALCSRHFDIILCNASGQFGGLWSKVYVVNYYGGGSTRQGKVTKELLLVSIKYYILIVCMYSPYMAKSSLLSCINEVF